MTILVGDEIRLAIRRCKPTRIAVAYIGADWNSFVSDADSLEAIIVSPTLGTNPRAVAALVKSIGWNKVFFLDNLHAKTYIGMKSAIIGSANLTHNGLSGEKLIEVCVEGKSDDDLKKADEIFRNFRAKAQKQYPTVMTKKARLKELEKVWSLAIAQGIIKKKRGRVQNFLDFELLGQDHFYVVWYQHIGCEYSDDVKAIQSLMAGDAHFVKEDNVEKNKWVLMWQITDSSVPHKKTKPSWLYIHDVFDKGVIDNGYDYPKCAIERKDMDLPPRPFEITEKVEAAFKKVIQEKEIARYLIQKNRDTFRLNYSLKGVPLLIRRMKQEIERL